MPLDALTARPLDLPFREAFRHASAERSSMQSLWVSACGGGFIGHGEGCPREYVTGESLAGAQTFVASHVDEWRSSIHDLASLRDWIERNHALIDRHPAAWAAVELALLDLFAQQQDDPVERLLGLPPLSGRFEYSAVLGDAETGRFAAQLARYVRHGFRDFKIKLSGDAVRDRQKIEALTAAGIAPDRVRADANNLWRDPAIAADFITALGMRFGALEEPLAAGDIDALGLLAERLDTRIILDESLLRIDQLDRLADAPARWIVNVRVSKMGGLIRSLALVEAARSRGVSLIVGAHVGETSLLTRAALTIADHAGARLLAQEGAVGTHLLETDPVQPSLMFGAGGVLDIECLGIAARPGWGLTVAALDAAT
ncbi:MAG: hypothetical protein JNK71_05565 [Methyloversatilis sp.]|nr:hypothetical protein [Methyloversatilis sp.]